MNAALRRGVVSGIFAGGFVLLGVATATAASADTGEPGLALAGSTDGSDGVGSGNQTVLDLDSPVRAVGNQVTALGDHNENTTTAEAPAAPSPRPAPAPDHTSGEDGAGSGNQSVVGVEAPVQAVGNQVAALGDHNENDADPAESPSAPAPGPASTPAHTSGEEGVGSGNQTTITACAPISVDGNQVTVVGDDNHGAAGSSPDACESASVGGSGETSGEDGVGSGNQSSVEVCAPVTISGNQVTGVGDDNHATSDDAASTCGGGEATSGHTSGEDGVGSGNQTGLDVCAPVTASGNQLTVVGDDNHAGSSGERSSCDDAGQDGGTPGDTSGEEGLGSGNQTVLDPTVPVDVIGNQVTVIGDGNANDSTTSGGDGAGDGDGGGTGDTSGEDGAGSGNQTVLDPTVPVEAIGNQVTVIGDGNANDSTTSGGDGAGDGDGGGTGDTSGEDGAGSGNQTVLDPTVPVEVIGNHVTVIGDGNDSTTSGGDGAGDGGGTGDTSGADGAGSGNQTVLDPTVPVDVIGNQVTVIGDDNANESTDDSGDVPGEGPGDGDGDDPGDDGGDGGGDDPGDGGGDDPGDGGGDDPGDDGDGDDSGEGPGGTDGGVGSPGDTDVLPGQARAGALVAAPQAPTEVRAGLGVTNPAPPSPAFPLLMLVTGVLCLALAGRRCAVRRV